MAGDKKSILIASLTLLSIAFSAFAESPFFELTLKADTLALKEQPRADAKNVALLVPHPESFFTFWMRY